MVGQIKQLANFTFRAATNYYVHYQLLLVSWLIAVKKLPITLNVTSCLFCLTSTDNLLLHNAKNQKILTIEKMKLRNLPFLLEKLLPGLISYQNI